MTESHPPSNQCEHTFTTPDGGSWKAAALDLCPWCEIERLLSVYESAVGGRRDFREAYRQARDLLGRFVAAWEKGGESMDRLSELARNFAPSSAPEPKPKASDSRVSETILERLRAYATDLDRDQRRRAVALEEQISFGSVYESAAEIIWSRDEIERLERLLVPQVCCGDFDNCRQQCIPLVDEWRRRASVPPADSLAIHQSNFRLIAALCIENGGTIRVKARHMRSINPRETIDVREDPETGDRIFTFERHSVTKVVAQHGETGRMWEGPRDQIPHGYIAVDKTATQGEGSQQ